MGGLAEDICDLLSATVLFMSASSFPANLVLLGSARRVLTPLPSGAFPPGMTYFGFGAEEWLSQLCGIFGGAVVGYQPDAEYYLKEGQQMAKSGVMFGGVSAALTRDFPMEKIRVRHCAGSVVASVSVEK